MDKLVFVDTSGWAALKNRNDDFCDLASNIKEKLLLSGYKFITTDYILDETYTLLSVRASHRVAVEFGEEIQKSSLIEILQIDVEMQKQAWKLFKRYKDKDFSFTDCTSFVVMKNLNISLTLTADHHFEQSGYQILLK